MKKFLSVALALAMTLSLVVVGASATEYKDLKDKDQIQHSEAVSVMNKIGVISGYTDGTFKPTASITRGAAAKIVCYAKLGATVASALSSETAPFKDVSVKNVFAPYITYCTNMKIVNGYADKTFRPSTNLTGYAFAKMLLNALGITGTYTGNGWEVNVATAAQNAHFFTGIDSTVAMSKALSRDNACQMALNAMVYSASGSTVYRVQVTTANGTTRNTTPVNYDFATSSDALSFFAVMNSQLDKTANTTAGLITAVVYRDKQTSTSADSLLTSVFKVTCNTSATDSFGRPATTYTNDSWTSSMVFDATADYTFTGAVSEAAMYAKVGVTAATTYTWSKSVDGVTTSPATAPSKTSTTAYANTTVGSKTEVFLNSTDKTAKVVVVNTYLDTVNKIAAKTDTTARTVTLSNGLTFATDSFAQNDVVLYTKASNVVQSMETAPVITGTLEKVVTSSGVSTYTVAGKDYVVSKNGGSTSMTAANLNKVVSFYVDDQGNIMRDKSATDAAATYIYILGNADTKASSSYLSSVNSYVTEVYGVTSDGKYGTYNIASTLNQYKLGDLKDKTYSYTVDSTGVLTLQSAVTAKNTAAIAMNASTVAVTGPATPILNSDTQFIFVETKSATDNTVSSVTVKTGSANIGSTIAIGNAVVCAESGVAKFAFVTGAYTDSSMDSGKIAYVDHTSEKNVTTYVNGAVVTSYTYTAYANDGTTVTLSSANKIAADGVYKYNANMSVGVQITAATTGVITAINGSAITVGATTLNTTDKTAKIYLGSDADLKVGQTVTYVANTTYTSNFDAIFVTGDQVVKTMTITGSGVTGVTPATADVITGAGVVNTIAIKVPVTADGKGITVSGNSGTVALVGGTYTTTTADVTAGYATINVTVTAPTADGTITVTLAA